MTTKDKIIKREKELRLLKELSENPILETKNPEIKISKKIKIEFRNNIIDSLKSEKERKW